MDLRNLSADHRLHLSSNSSDCEAFLSFLIHNPTHPHMPSGSCVSECVRPYMAGGGG